MVNGEHIKLKTGGRAAGTSTYWSRWAHENYLLSRADDIESLAYVLIEFLRGELPWSHFKDTDDELSKMLQMKKTMKMEVKTFSIGLVLFIHFTF